MRDPITVTVALATYNRAEDYLPQALASAVAQTYPHLEILVSDNHSTDHTEEVVRGMRDGRIRYVRQPENLGANANFNACLEAATGEYFVLLHDDDLLEPTMVARCVKELGKRRGVGLVLTGARVVDDRGRAIRERPMPVPNGDDSAFVLAWLDGSVPLYLCSTMYHAGHLRSVGGFRSPNDLYDDVAATLRVMFRYGRVCVPEIQAGFRQHVGNRGSGQAIRSWIDDAVFLADLIARELPQASSATLDAVRSHLARKSMARVDVMGGPLDRLRWGAYAYRAFAYRYGPWRYLAWKLGSRWRSLRRSLMHRLRRVATHRDTVWGE